MLKLLGYDEWCLHLYVRFLEDYVYDGDPGHPESHKKGAVHLYEMTHRNSDGNNSQYSAPHVFDTAQWLYAKYNLLPVVRPMLGETGTFEVTVEKMVPTDGREILVQSFYVPNPKLSPEENYCIAWKKGINNSLIFLKKDVITLQIY